MEKFDFDGLTHPLLGTPTLTVSTIAGGTAINVVPEEALIGVDIRTRPGQDGTTLRANRHPHRGVFSYAQSLAFAFVA